MHELQRNKTAPKHERITLRYESVWIKRSLEQIFCNAPCRRKRQRYDMKNTDETDMYL